MCLCTYYIFDQDGQASCGLNKQQDLVHACCKAVNHCTLTTGVRQMAVRHHVASCQHAVLCAVVCSHTALLTDVGCFVGVQDFARPHLSGKVCR